MSYSGIAIGFIVAASALLSGCAVNRATASVEPSARLGDIRSVHIVRLPADERKINQLIADRLGQMGLVATTGDDKRRNVDAIVTYLDRWYWDITMYMIELTIVVRNPSDDFPVATGNSLHTSLTRKSPPEMVDEVLTNIWKEVKK